MKLARLATLIPAVAGAALIGAGVSGADTGTDAVQSDWLFPGFNLPGVATGNLTDIAPFTSEGTLTYAMPVGDGFENYTASDTQFSIPFVFDATHQVVTTGSDATPPVGTVVDQVGPYLINAYIETPDGDFGDRLSLLNMSNTFIADQAGVEDYITAFGQEHTLFDFPS